MTVVTCDKGHKTWNIDYKTGSNNNFLYIFTCTVCGESFTLSVKNVRGGYEFFKNI